MASSAVAQRLTQRGIRPTPPTAFTNAVYEDANTIRQLHITHVLGGPNGSGRESGGGHTGCVNTLAWSSTGQLLLSGSDDTTLGLWRSDRDYELVARYPTRHQANIFSARFMPCTGDSVVVSASLDGQILVHDLHRDITSFEFPPGLSSTTAALGRSTHSAPTPSQSPPFNLRQVYTCHGDPVKRIVCEDDNPFVFLSCGEDGRIRQFDLRERVHHHPAPAITNTSPGHRPPWSRSDRADPCSRWLVDFHDYGIHLTTLALNQHNKNYLASGGANYPCAFLHDRRMLPVLVNSPTSSLSSSASSSLSSSDLLPPQSIMRFIPPQIDVSARAIFPTAVTFSRTNPHELLGSWSHECVYLFDIRSTNSGSAGGNHSDRASTTMDTTTVPQRAKRRDHQSPALSATSAAGGPAARRPKRLAVGSVSVSGSTDETVPTLAHRRIHPQARYQELVGLRGQSAPPESPGHSLNEPAAPTTTTPLSQPSRPPPGGGFRFSFLLQGRGRSASSPGRPAELGGGSGTLSGSPASGSEGHPHPVDRRISGMTVLSPLSGRPRSATTTTTTPYVTDTTAGRNSSSSDSVHSSPLAEASQAIEACLLQAALAAFQGHADDAYLRIADLINHSRSSNSTPNTHGPPIVDRSTGVGENAQSNSRSELGGGEMRGGGEEGGNRPSAPPIPLYRRWLMTKETFYQLLKVLFLLREVHRQTQASIQLVVPTPAGATPTMAGTAARIREIFSRDEDVVSAADYQQFGNVVNRLDNIIDTLAQADMAQRRIIFNPNYVSVAGLSSSRIDWTDEGGPSSSPNSDSSVHHPMIALVRSVAYSYRAWWHLLEPTGEDGDATISAYQRRSSCTQDIDRARKAVQLPIRQCLPPLQDGGSDSLSGSAAGSSGLPHSGSTRNSNRSGSGSGRGCQWKDGIDALWSEFECTQNRSSSRASPASERESSERETTMESIRQGAWPVHPGYWGLSADTFATYALLLQNPLGERASHSPSTGSGPGSHGDTDGNRALPWHPELGSMLLRIIDQNSPLAWVLQLALTFPALALYLGNVPVPKPTVPADGDGETSSHRVLPRRSGSVYSEPTSTVQAQNNTHQSSTNVSDQWITEYENHSLDDADMEDMAMDVDDTNDDRIRPYHRHRESPTFADIELAGLSEERYDSGISYPADDYVESDEDEPNSETDDDDVDSEDAFRDCRWGTRGPRSTTFKREAAVDMAQPIQKYFGHVNALTTKDVGFFGPHDEYVMSGSDDGNLFLWTKRTGRLAQLIQGDGEVVNVAVGHPTLPYLAVSGIDDTIKIMAPYQRHDCPYYAWYGKGGLETARQGGASEGENVRVGDGAAVTSTNMHTNGTPAPIFTIMRNGRVVDQSNSRYAATGGGGGGDPSQRTEPIPPEFPYFSPSLLGREGEIILRNRVQQIRELSQAVWSDGLLFNLVGHSSDSSGSSALELGTYSGTPSESELTSGSSSDSVDGGALPETIAAVHDLYADLGFGSTSHSQGSDHAGDNL
ncbi:hypothetical protein BJ085DRAFT_37250 [Dimargaris cristalligena]|uniref:WD40-repeat-containing domain protein n=1 Tax=Dimargaris cristalligena TaxID=215637 RepID=A0A4Q0A1L3_9FUNG|nr:hypothetical protein BJ085DRAFT_37250 [Dimargaris cristalligena]|eukprot:RKP39668.1 hypothetical protein BJ085DRAFT_37250 [Dimargaris cristalligena]